MARRLKPEEIVARLRQVDVLASRERTVGDALRLYSVFVLATAG